MAEETPPTAPTTGGRPPAASDTSKLLAALGYPLWIVALIAILMDPYKNEGFVKFHAYQALAANLAVFVLGMVLSFVFIGIFIWPLWLIYSIFLAIKAYQGEYVEVPLIYGFVKKYVGE